MRTSLGMALLALGLFVLFGDCRLPPAVLQSKPAPSSQPIGISAHTLVQFPEAYTGRRVRFLLIARSYRCVPLGLIWVDGHPRSPSLIIECQSHSGLSAVDVVGTCRGRIGDTVLVGDCIVTIIPDQP